MERIVGELHPLTAEDIANIPNNGERTVAAYMIQINPSGIEIFHQQVKCRISPGEASELHQVKRVYVPDFWVRNTITGDMCYVEVTDSHKGRKKSERAILDTVEPGVPVVIVGGEELRTIMSAMDANCPFQPRRSEQLDMLKGVISLPLSGD